MLSAGAQGFYPASEFAVHRTYLADGKRGGLAWPEYVQLSSDHTHPRWRFTSHRRLKNVIVILEWLPAVDATAAAGAAAATAAGAGAAAADARHAPPLSDGQRERLQRVFEMYDATRGGWFESAVCPV